MGFRSATCKGVLGIVSRWDEVEGDWALQIPPI